MGLIERLVDLPKVNLRLPQTFVHAERDIMLPPSRLSHRNDVLFEFNQDPNVKIGIISAAECRAEVVRKRPKVATSKAGSIKKRARTGDLQHDCR